MKIDRPLNTNLDNLSLEINLELESAYFTESFQFRRIGSTVFIVLDSAYQIHSWNSGTTRIYTSTPTSIAPSRSVRFPLFRNQSCIGYISVAPTSGIYVNSQSAINDGESVFNCYGTYVYN